MMKIQLQTPPQAKSLIKTNQFIIKTKMVILICEKSTLREPFSFFPENQINCSLVRPGGLHAIFIRSALPAVQVYEQAVTGLGLSQTQSAGSQRGREKR